MELRDQSKSAAADAAAVAWVADLTVPGAVDLAASVGLSVGEGLDGSWSILRILPAVLMLKTSMSSQRTLLVITTSS